MIVLGAWAAWGAVPGTGGGLARADDPVPPQAPPAPPAPPAPQDPPVPPAPAPDAPPAPPEAPPAPAAPVPEPPPPPVPDPAAPPPCEPEKPEAPKADAPKPEAPQPEAAEPEEPKKEEPKKEEPKKEESAPVEDTASKAAVVATLPSTVPVRPAPPPIRCWSGTASMRFRGRIDTDSDHDADLYEYLALRYGKDSDKGWSASFYGRLAEDLDGNDSSSNYYVFDGVDDTYHSSVTGRLYHLYASYRFDCGFLERVRIGRQNVDGGYPFLVDGIHATTAPVGVADFQASAFVGLPAHLFEGSPEGDFICGAGVAFRPWQCADARVDWVYVEDENSYYGTPKNNLFTGELRQKLAATTSGRLWYQQVDDHPREIGISGLSYLTDCDVALRGSFRSQIQEENALVYDIDSFTAIEQTLFPYWDAHGSVSKGFCNDVIVEGGVTARGLWSQSDEGTFNREFVRLYATVSRSDFPRRDVTLSLTGEYWASHDDVFSGGFDATWKPSSCFRLSAGLDYALYRTDIYTATERYESYGAYGRVTFVPARSWKADVTLRFEDDDAGTFFTLQAGLGYDF